MSSGEEMKKEDEEPWMYETFGCFDDWRLCLATFLCPCYTVGRNAEAFGEDGVMTGVWYGIGCCFGVGAVLRWRLRQRQNLRGNMLGDITIHVLAPCCALIQENKQLYGIGGSHIGERIPINQEINRK